MYYGLFPDIEYVFGCEGNFFRLSSPPPLMLCNPPFERFVMNAFFDRLLELMTKGKSTALVVVAAFNTADRRRLNELKECKERYPTDYETDVFTAKLVDSPMRRWGALYCKDKFPYMDFFRNKRVCYTATLAVVLSSYACPPLSPKSISSVLPDPNIIL